jgi:hypothetical protein
MQKNVNNCNNNLLIAEGEQWFESIVGKIVLIEPGNGRKHSARLIGLARDGFIFQDKSGHQWFMKRSNVIELTVLRD